VSSKRICDTKRWIKLSGEINPLAVEVMKEVGIDITIKNQRKLQKI
jgi:hypothetical protein